MGGLELIKVNEADKTQRIPNVKFGYQLLNCEGGSRGIVHGNRLGVCGIDRDHLPFSSGVNGVIGQRFGFLDDREGTQGPGRRGAGLHTQEY